MDSRDAKLLTQAISKLDRSVGDLVKELKKLNRQESRFDDSLRYFETPDNTQTDNEEKE